MFTVSQAKVKDAVKDEVAEIQKTEKQEKRDDEAEEAELKEQVILLK